MSRHPQKAQRQDAYHRALAVACANTDLLFGQFQKNRKERPIPGCISNPRCVVRVLERTEKGSDVKLASRLVHDAHLGRFDRAIVVTGDSDLVEPIRLVVSEVGKIVWVRNPRDQKSDKLEAASSSYGRIRLRLLLACQLPNPVVDGLRRYDRPVKWGHPAQKFAREIRCTFSCSVAGCAKQVELCHYVERAGP